MLNLLQMKRGIIIPGILLFFNIFLSAQTNLTKSIASDFSVVWHHVPQEKIYLQTDKAFYSAGEKIWFSAYTVNAATHKNNSKSKYAYIELINRFDSVVVRVKVKKDSLGFAGHIDLNPEIPEGEYILRAYTYWMQNAGTDFFFRKKINIGNLIDDRVRLKSDFSKQNTTNITAVFEFKNSLGFPLEQKNIVLQQSWLPSNKNRVSMKTNAKGEIRINIPIDSLQTTKKVIDVIFAEPGFKFNQKIPVPDYQDDFDVQFMAESGTFLNDQMQTVAFKALGKNGLSTEISGRIFNNKNEEVSEINSNHRGMGKFVLKTFPTEKYYAIVSNNKGLSKKIHLPATEEKGISLRLISNKGKIYYQVMNQTDIGLSSLYLMAHSRGVVYFIAPFNNPEGHFPENNLPAGICSFSIIDSLKNIYCERLHFIRNFDFPSISLESNKTTYNKREPVALKLNIRDKEGKPVSGNFSLSVTDSKLVENDSINDNIISYLLLSSDIRGYIEKPQDYFIDNSAQTREKTDLLMLTQGWKRFSTANVLKAKYPATPYYMEIGQSISGKVANLVNKPSKGTNIVMLCSYKNQINATKTDSLGQFILDGIQFPDSTSIILKAQSKSKITDVEIIPDKDQFPSYKQLIPLNDQNLISSKSYEYLQLNKEKYYNEGGMLVVNLAEFNVDAKAKPESDASFYSGMADNTFSAEKIAEHPGQSILVLLSMFPGVSVNGDQISIRGATGNPLILIDDIETNSIEDIQYLSSNDLEEISLFKGASTSLWGSRGGNGVIAIQLKKGFIATSPTPPSLALITPLGFQKPMAFYEPAYDVDSIYKNPKTDLRTTIYWNPSLKSDPEGNVLVNFFTADKANDYHLELEGIGVNGEICRYKGKLKRQND